jgi:hypothetical protein
MTSDLQVDAVTRADDVDMEADVAMITAAGATTIALDTAAVTEAAIATAATVNSGEEEAAVAADIVVNAATVSEMTTAMEVEEVVVDEMVDENASIATPLVHARTDTNQDHPAKTDVAAEMPTMVAAMVVEMTAQDLPMAAARHLPHANPMLAAAAEGSTIGVILGTHAEEVLSLTSSDSKRA